MENTNKMKSSYLSRLESVYNSKSSLNKIDYIRYNFGSIIQSIGLKKDFAALEIGPGRGEFIGYLQSLGINKMDIVDSDKNVLEFLKKKFKVDGYFSDNVISVDNQLGQYDLIILIQVLEHMPPTLYLSVIKSLYSKLKKNGFIVIVVPNANNPLGLVERYGDLQHHSAFTEQSLKDLVIYSKITNPYIQIRGYQIPPYNLVNMVRIILQKVLHLFLLIIMIINGGTYFKVMTPNITLIIRKK